MRRVVAALALLAIVAVVASAGTFSSYSTTVSNPAATGTATSFLPVNQTAPSITGTVGLLSASLSLSQGSWGYTAPTGTVDRTGEQAIGTPTDQWQYCLSGTCTNIAGATGTVLSVTNTTLGLVNLTGVTFRVQETAANASGTASAVNSNSL